MYRSVETSSPGTTAPHRPAPPVALSDFIARTTPFTEYTNFYDGPASSPEATRTETNGLSMQMTGQHVQQGQKTEPTGTPTPPEAQELPSRNDGWSSEWLATRSQLMPSRHQGKKADWVRGWSEAVVVHGTETYCCCSETLDANQGGKSKRNDITGAVRFIRLGANPTPTKEASSDETINICPNCSRPPSPPLSPLPSAPSEDNTPARQSQSFGKKVTDLLKRVKQSHSANKRDAEIRELTRPNSQPRWLSAQRLAAAHQQTVQKSQSMDILRNRNNRAIATPSSDSDSSDPDAPPGRQAMAKSKSRLRRAAALLQRTARPNV
ncbi:hypothetical protein QBC38DRAFT_356801 [Podospora fimiseda]|uniref:Uncharacterized protein n=1 Tax=Podospora fimiseda TaxID=252190 RepID=A0AAN7H056_9PEZI|nr:hypothetical protein QBC38DRAFT_356801 [Podospora fimiseda]